MIQLRILGPISLTGPDGRSLDDVVAQSRRLALLAYMAMRAPRGFVRRDALLPLFWPELDQDRARGALRQAVYFLRHSLGSDVLVSRGLEEVGIAPDALWCDATAFESAVAARSLTEALALYGGELLESFFISEAAEFEQWMQSEQTRLRTMAAEAALDAAADADRAGDGKEAAELLRRGLALRPTDEGTLRKLIATLDGQGDRATALEAYETFAQQLEVEFGASPSAETRALVAQVRTRNELNVVVTPQPLATPPVSPPLEDSHDVAAPPAVAPHTPLDARPASAVHRSRRRWIVMAAALIVAAGIVRGLLARQPSEAETAGRVVILPFDVRGGPEYAYLREALVDLLSTNLDGAGGMQTIDPSAVLNGVDRNAALEPSTGRQVSRRFKARYFVMGQVVESAGRLRMRASLFDERSGDEPVLQVSREGNGNDLFALIDALSADLLAGVAGGRGDGLRAAAARTTSSLTALKAYLEGESAFRAGQHAAAIEALKRAVAADSTFALAHYRLSVVGDWARTPWLAQYQAAQRAKRFASGLSDRDRSLVDAHLASFSDAYVESDQLYRDILLRYPDEIEGWLKRAEILYHRSEFTDYPIGDARQAFERVVELDSSHGPALVHLARIAIAEGRTQDFSSLSGRILALHPNEDREVEVRTLGAFAVGTPADKERWLRALRRFPRGTTVWVTAIVARDIDAAERIARVDLESTRSVVVQTRAHLTLADLHVARGRLTDAGGELRRAETLHRLRGGDRSELVAAVEQSALLALLPFHAAGANELTAIHARLLAWAAPPEAGPFGSVTRYDQWHPHFRSYLLGMVEAGMHDGARARARADSIEALPVPEIPDARAFTFELARAVRARTLWVEGKPAEALRMLESVPPAPPNYYRGFFTRTFGRFMRAELLRLAGREAEALPLYGSFENGAIQQLAFAAPSHFRRAEILERQGDRAGALRSYRRFLALWGSADAQFRPQVDSAERRVRVLEAVAAK